MALNDPNEGAESSDPPPRPASGPIRELALLVGVGLAALAAVAVWAGTRAPAVGPPGKVASGYVGEAACRDCHPVESARFHKSGHGRTLRTAAGRPEVTGWIDGKRADDPEHPEVSFRYAFRDGRLAAERVAPGSVESMALQYAFGSGEHATTFVTMNEADAGSARPTGIEHRLTLFNAPDRHLGLTPGQDAESDVPDRLKAPIGRVLDPDAARKCFDCHSTRLSDRGPETLDLATLMPNVSCERCHGPGEAHVASARRGDRDLRMPFGHGRYTPNQMMQLCGHCHRLPEMAPAGSIRPENAELARFQPVGLMASACYKQSGGALTCATCHDPHARASGQQTSYEAACLGCHKAAPQKVCGVSPLTGCVGCHMPRRDAGQRVFFADHWIRVHPEASSASTTHPALPAR